MALLNWITNNKQSKKGVVGIEVGDRDVAFAHLKTSSNPELLSCEHLSAANLPSTTSQLRDSVASLKLEGTPCNVALTASDYSLLLVEAPKIPDDELRDAMRWKIKDLSPIPVDQAVVDVFRMPEDAGSIGKGMVFTVVAKKRAIENAVSLVEDAGLTINAIDIPELCLRNIAQLKGSSSNNSGASNHGSNNQSILIARLMAAGSQVTAISKGNVYLSRSFPFRYSGGAIPPEQAESLTLELQRSADYLRHQMGQPPQKQILLLGDGLRDSDLPASINDSFSGEVRVLNPASSLAVAAGINDVTLSKCSIAIGAALRDTTSSKKGRAL